MRISDWSSYVCSSDLRRVRSCVAACPSTTSSQQPPRSAAPAEPSESALLRMERKRKARNHFPQFLPRGDMNDAQRSEEHTSELQSLMRISYAVFCLKKKTKTQEIINMSHYRTTQT